MSRLEITLRNEIVGAITFTQPERSLGAVRTAWGFRLSIPALVTLLPPSGSGAPLILENLRAVFGAGGLEIGVSEYRLTLRTGIRDQPITLSWDWTLPAWVVYERLRAGKDPQFAVTVSGDIRYVLTGESGKEPCSIAIAFYRSGQVVYSQRAWTDMLRAMNLRDAVLIEIPFPSDPPNGWEPIWQALRDARDSFDAGGATGWKNCIASIRHALEEWQDLEKEDQGPGWHAPNKVERESRTKQQRIDNIRWHLIQLAHYAAHTRADEWTRDDALLALSTLCSLLAVRRP